LGTVAGKLVDDVTARTRIERRTMDAPAPYFHWGFIQISLPNLVVILVMLLIFVLALVLPFPGHGDAHDRDGDPR